MELMIVLVVALLLGAGIGLWLGYALSEERCEQRIEDVYALFEGTPMAPRTKGQPTNVEGPEARVTRARYQERRRWDLQGEKPEGK